MKYCFLLFVCCWFCSRIIAQKANFKLTENSIVRDSGGTVYPFLVWRNLLMQGSYEIRPVDKQNEKTDFLLVKLTEQERDYRLAQMPKPSESTYFKTGTDFPPFKTSDIDNNKINLKEGKGKITVLNFWFINCPPCRMEIPALNELVETFKGNDSVRFVGIALDNKSSLQDFFKIMHFNYSIVDNGRFLAEKYGIRSFPTHVIIDQQGKVYFHTTGLAMNTVYWLKKSINELVNPPVVATATPR
jgi:peroxiredoxin